MPSPVVSVVAVCCRVTREHWQTKVSEQPAASSGSNLDSATGFRFAVRSLTAVSVPLLLSEPEIMRMSHGGYPCSQQTH